MAWAYLGFLTAALGAMVLLDVRLRLFFWQDTRRAAIVLVAGIIFFLAWDIAGIAAGIFYRGTAEVMLGVLVGPELPVEEVVFLTFLCYLTMNVYGLFCRLIARRRPVSEEPLQ